MKTFAATLILVLAACATTPAPRVHDQIQAEYDKLAAAFERQDVDGVLSFRAPDFHTIPPNGGPPDTYEAMANYTRNWLLVQNKPPIEVDFTVLSIEMQSPDIAAVKVLQKASRYQDREGKRVHVRHEVTQRETWRRTPQGWKIFKVDQIDLAGRKRWVDGVLEK
jgi:ketosteroid isomerase-like protein